MIRGKESLRGSWTTTEDAPVSVMERTSWSSARVMPTKPPPAVGMATVLLFSLVDMELVVVVMIKKEEEALGDVILAERIW